MTHCIKCRRIIVARSEWERYIPLIRKRLCRTHARKHAGNLCHGCWSALSIEGRPEPDDSAYADAADFDEACRSGAWVRDGLIWKRGAA
jgi:hypothetical protein